MHPDRRAETSPYHRAEADLRRRLTTDALAWTGGQKIPAARVLGVSRSTLKTWVREFQIDCATLAQYRAPAPPPYQPLAPDVGAPWTIGGLEGAVWTVALDLLREKMLRDALVASKWRPLSAARLLGIDPLTVYRWREAYAIRRPTQEVPDAST